MFRKFTGQSVLLLLKALGFSSLLVTLSFAQSISSPTSRSSIANPNRFARIPISEPFLCDQSTSHCGRTVLADLGRDGPGVFSKHQSREETFTFANGVVVYLLTIRGLENDAVDAERYRVAFKQNGDALQLVQVGFQQRCMRGASARRWTKGVCP